MYDGHKNWIDAKSHCERDSAQLAIEYTDVTHDYIKRQYGTKKMWIGATDNATEDAWFWVDGKPVLESHSYWDASNNEPNGGTGENCINTNPNGPGTWNDLRCNVQLPF